MYGTWNGKFGVEGRGIQNYDRWNKSDFMAQIDTSNDHWVHGDDRKPFIVMTSIF